MNKVVAFDLGGVLVDVDLDSLETLSPVQSSALDSERTPVRDAYFRSSRHEQMTVGQCDGECFIAEAAQILQVEPKLVLAKWRNVVRPYAGAPQLVREVQGATVVVWSNTDPLHTAVLRADFPPIVSPSSALSFELGAAKPDRLFYQRALKRLGAAPAQVLFLDNLPDNVQAAKELGIDAVCVQGLDETEQVLRTRGFLPKRTA